MTDFVFLHGGGQGGWVWDETIAALRQQTGDAVRCLALDAPGCGGKRERATDELGFEEINRSLVDDVIASGFRDAVLVGHSQAGTNLPVMAALRPGLFRKLVFVSCIAPDPGLTVIEMTGERIHGADHPLNDPSLSFRERFRALFCNDMPQPQAEAFLDKLGADNWPPICYSHREWHYEHLAEIPITYVMCLRDAILPLAWQERMAERVHAERTARIDAGHQVMNTRPQALAEILLLEAAA